MKIWGRALNRIQIDAAARIVWSAISREDLAEMDATSKETHGILDELISTIPDADVYVLFTETEDGGLKASMRSTAAIDVSRLAGMTYGGGGHARASGFKVAKFENFQLQVLECVQKLKEGMRAQTHDDAMRDIPPMPQPVKQQVAPVVQPVAPVVQAPGPKQLDVIQTVRTDSVQPGGTDVLQTVSSPVRQ